MIYFHYCQTYKNSVSQIVDETVRKILSEYSNQESLKGIGKISSFTGGLYVLQIKSPFHEIILEEQKIDVKGQELTVYFVRGFKEEGLQDYIEIRDGKWLGYRPLQKNEIENFKLELEQKQNEKITKIKPPEQLTKWQSDYKLRVDYDIYESEEWVKFALNSSLESGMKDDEAKMYRLVLIEIFKTDIKSKEKIIKTNGNEKVIAIELNDIGIVYSKIQIQNRTIYLLHNGANTKTQKSHWEEIKKPENINNYTYNSVKDISSVALKAYPNWALSDADLWARIEKNNEMGNLSLLPEQTEFLKDFKFPKYINGQAGSGKSTMLYYLFANAYYYKYAGEIEGDIIFLTENEKLLDHTKRSVYDLLLFNPEFDLTSENVAITNVDKHFYPFKTFLLNLLPENNKDFDLEKYLNFSKFKTLYEGSKIATHIKKSFSAELIWFTISTYVYGNDLDFQITSENYEEKMPKEGKELISLEDLKGIEKEVIKPFYEKLLIEGYWDKIKLIKYLNKNIEIQKQYEVIFCDEAQDFSRVELKFILKLSVYTKYDLSEVEQFPVVFAGDALQTVNPTGFRSEVLTSMIYKELTNEPIGFKLEPSQLEFTPTYNYRSTQAIVNIANSIQYYRKKELGAEIKYPQTSKRPILYKNEHLNVFVDFESFINDETLQDKIEFKTIIVPVNFDEIEVYQKTHPILKKFKNIISAVDAKGIDFNEVVVYGFGEFKEINSFKAYENRFFFNKLYVAVTRAQTELVIIDSAKSQKTFWIPIIEKYISSNWIKDLQLSLEKFNDIVIFDSKDIIQSAANIVEDDAKRQKERGVIEKNIPLLHVASSHFIKIGNKKEYYLCLAEIEEINENWEKAAEYYLKKDIGVYGLEKLANVFWKGQLWQKLIGLNDKIINSTQQIRHLIAKLFCENTLTGNDLSILNEKNRELRDILNNTSWRNLAIKRLLNLFESPIDDDESKLICSILEECGNDNDKNVWETLGEIYFRTGRYESAVIAFVKIRYEGELFLKSKLEIARRKANVEEIIIWLGRLAIETDTNKLELASEIIYFYSKNEDKIIEFKNIYVFEYIYFSYLLKEPQNSNIISLAQKVEKSFETRETELAEGYMSLLKNDLIDESIFNFILERWCKNCSEGGITSGDINEMYRKLALEKGILYAPFSEEEIFKILVLPNELITELPSHIANIHIKNFRGFKDVAIENLGLFNLVVGDNNIGKTSLLEALLFTPNKKTYLERLAFAYIERTNIYPDKTKDSKEILLHYNLNKNFVYDFQFCDENKGDIEFHFAEKRNFWNYKITFDGKGDLESLNNEIIFCDDDYELLKQIPHLNSLKQPFVAYGKGFSPDLAQIYLDEIGTKRKEEQEFIQRMSVFIPTIDRIIPDTKSGFIDIRDKDFPEDRPLHQYGEAANKLFRILLLLTLHKGKRLLIDEIDAGIHYSRFKEFWSIILNIAMEDNTQIIATTHNDECIRYFVEVLSDEKFGKKYQSESRVVQMKLVKNIKIRSYEFESFNLAIEDGIEIRGGQNL